MQTAIDRFLQYLRVERNASDLTVKIDRARILSNGRPAVRRYLQQLHVLKATADFENAKEMYDEITAVDDWYENTIRPAVMAKKVPRKVFVQANTVREGEGDGVVLKEYPATPEGMIQSFADREYI